MSDITDWNVREVKTPVEYVNSNLPPAGSKIISAFILGDKAESLTIPLLLEFCKNHARESGLEFRNIKEIGKLGKVVKGARKIVYTAEERGECKHKLSKEECRLCKITQQVQMDNLRKKIEKKLQDDEKERLMKEMSEENWRRKTCVHGLDLFETCLSCNDERAKKLMEKVRGGEISSEKVKTDKENFDLTQIPVIGLIELGKVFKEGEMKYGLDNWKLGREDKRYRLERANHAAKHLLNYIHELRTGEKLGEEGENDLAKVAWFCMTEIEFERLKERSE